MVRIMVTEVIVNLIEESDTLEEVIEALSGSFGEDGNLYTTFIEQPTREKVSGYKLA